MDEQPATNLDEPSYSPQIIIVIGLVILLGIFIATAITYRKLDNLPDNQPLRTSQPEDSAQTAKRFGEIGLAAENEHLSVLVNKVDCSENSETDDSASSHKLCLISLRLNRLSDDGLSLKLSDFFLRGADGLSVRYAVVHYSASDQLNPTLARQLSEIDQKALETKLVFRIPAETAPNRLVIETDDPLTVYLDHSSADNYFDCHQNRTFSLNSRLSDCSYGYHFNALDCSQALIPIEQAEYRQNMKLCIARVALKNISNDANASLYTPNITYRNVYSGFYHHSVYLLDQDGNRYQETYGHGLDYIFRDIVLPDVPNYYRDRVNLAPGESTDLSEPLFFIVPAEAEPNDLYLGQRVYNYWGRYLGSEASAGVRADSLSQSSSSSDTSPSGCSESASYPECLGARD